MNADNMNGDNIDKVPGPSTSTTDALLAAAPPGAIPEPPDADFAERVRRSFARQGLMAHLGARIVAVRPGQVAVWLPFRAELTQQDGFFHAGATSAVADSAGGYAALTLLDPGSGVLTVEFKINLLAPARGDALLAVGSVLKSGRTLSVTTLSVHAIEGTATTLCAAGQQTMIRRG